MLSTVIDVFHVCRFVLSSDVIWPFADMSWSKNPANCCSAVKCLMHGITNGQSIAYIDQ